MPKGPRKGSFRAPTGNILALHERRSSDSGALRLSVTSTPGHGIVDIDDIDFAPFAHTPLIANNIAAIRRGMINNATPIGLKAASKNFRVVQRYLEWYDVKFGNTPTKSDDVDARFTHQFISWQMEDNTSTVTKSNRTKDFKRFLTAIGVPAILLPPNPFRDEGGEDGAMDTLTFQQARQVLNYAKFEIEVIRRRTREAHRLAAVGHDPRRSAGGRRGDWDAAANRAWLIKRLLKRELHMYDDMRLELGHRTLLAGLEKRKGAEVIDSNGYVIRLGNWNGHLRWFFPWADDLTPFVALMMLRTGWNLSTVTSLQSRRWQKPYPYRVGSATEETHVYIVSHKTRGRDDSLTSAKVEQIPSARKPHSHPYRLLKFVEYLTAGLRKEVHRQRNVLLAKVELTPEEVEQLNKLEAIKDDLFLYNSRHGISSYRWIQGKEGNVAELTAFMKRAGVQIEPRRLRDAAVLFSYEASGQNLFIAQVLANHADRETTALYLRRRRTLERIWQDASRVFDASLKLIEQGEFSIPAVRQMLREQGLTDQQAENLMDPANTTRWGNRCADPTRPPPGFDRQANGGTCRTQDCIDGCPHARWFSESVEHVARQLVIAERQERTLGLESTEGSSLGSRIARCRNLLGRWPEAKRSAAIARARESLYGIDDHFFGTAL